MFKRKYGNKKIVINGIKFDSKLEHYCYSSLKRHKIDFRFQEKVVLLDKFRFKGKGIRSITLTVDFVVVTGGTTIYLDTKGFATEVSKIKYKMLRHKLIDDEGKTDVVWLKDEKEVNSFINNLIN